MFEDQLDDIFRGQMLKHLRTIEGQLGQVIGLLRKLTRASGAQGETMADAMTEFTKQLKRLQADFAQQIKALSDKLANHDDPVVAQAAVDMAALADSVEASIASINPPAPAPVPSAVPPAAPASTSGALSPASGPVGTKVTLAGSGFGTTQEGSFVSVGGHPAPVDSWSDTSIAFEIPAGPTGPADVVVTVNGVNSNAVSFSVTA